VREQRQKASGRSGSGKAAATKAKAAATKGPPARVQAPTKSDGQTRATTPKRKRKRRK
jgi:hypothetical protein